MFATNPFLQKGLQYDPMKDFKPVVLMARTGLTMVIDPMSLQYLVGGSVDYTEGLEGSRFTVTNPNASTTCGCGSSFSI